MYRPVMVLSTILVAAGWTPGWGQSPLAGSRAPEVAACCLQRGTIRVRTIRMVGGYIPFKDPRLEGDRLVGTVGSAEVAVPIVDISEIRARSGSRVLEGLGISLAAGLTASALVELNCDPLTCDKGKRFEVYSGTTAGAALIGALVGATLPRWEVGYGWQMQPGVQLSGS
jgi:hypothetical protein